MKARTKETEVFDDEAKAFISEVINENGIVICRYRMSAMKNGHVVLKDCNAPYDFFVLAEQTEHLLEIVEAALNAKTSKA